MNEQKASVVTCSTYPALRETSGIRMMTWHCRDTCGS